MYIPSMNMFKNIISSRKEDILNGNSRIINDMLWPSNLYWARTFCVINEADNFIGYNDETIELEESLLPVSCRAKAKGRICLLDKWADTAFCLCRAVQFYGGNVERLYFSVCITVSTIPGSTTGWTYALAMLGQCWTNVADVFQK